MLVGGKANRLFDLIDIVDGRLRKELILLYLRSFLIGAEEMLIKDAILLILIGHTLLLP